IEAPPGLDGGRLRVRGVRRRGLCRPPVGEVLSGRIRLSSPQGERRVREWDLSLEREPLGGCHVAQSHARRTCLVPAHRECRCFRHFCPGDRKSTRLNSSHVAISYAVFCLKKKKKKNSHNKV